MAMHNPTATDNAVSVSVNGAACRQVTSASKNRESVSDMRVLPGETALIMLIQITEDIQRYRREQQEQQRRDGVEDEWQVSCAAGLLRYARHVVQADNGYQRGGLGQNQPVVAHAG